MRVLAAVGLVHVDKVGGTGAVSVNITACTGFPHAADVVMGEVPQSTRGPIELPADVDSRAMTDDDMEAVREDLRGRHRDP